MWNGRAFGVLVVRDGGVLRSIWGVKSGDEPFLARFARETYHLRLFHKHNKACINRDGLSFTHDYQSERSLIAQVLQLDICVLHYDFNSSSQRVG
jgi:hypothetical protein